MVSRRRLNRPMTESWPNRTPADKKVQPKSRNGCTPSKPFAHKGYREIHSGRASPVALGVFPEIEIDPMPLRRRHAVPLTQ
jgi:hypothetical protein